MRVTIHLEPSQKEQEYRIWSQLLALGCAIDAEFPKASCLNASFFGTDLEALRKIKGVTAVFLCAEPPAEVQVPKPVPPPRTQRRRD